MCSGNFAGWTGSESWPPSFCQELAGRYLSDEMGGVEQGGMELVHSFKNGGGLGLFVLSWVKKVKNRGLVGRPPADLLLRFLNTNRAGLGGLLEDLVRRSKLPKFWREICHFTSTIVKPRKSKNLPL